jgi:asparagine synthase (glutamine-hydrolysing)
MGIYLGWALHGTAGEQPMPIRNASGDVALAFSGEDFSREQSKGPCLSYLVQMYEDDPSFPACLNGRFQGLVVDRKRKAAMLFNDRWGLQRIYYHETKDAFYFAAEAKSILAVCPECRTFDLRGVGEYVSTGCVLEDRSMFTGVGVLPPASAWRFENGTLHTRGHYFLPTEWEQQSTLDAETYYQQLREVFVRNLPRYFEGDQRVGLSLTGGLDTRMIMAWHPGEPGTLPSYSFGGMFRESQDVSLGREVAMACGQPHQVIPIGQDFLSRFPHYAERTVYLSDGCIGMPFSPDLYANEIVRKIAPVRMTGNYGGEVLRSVRAFKPEDPMAGLFCREMDTHLNQAKSTYDGLLHGHPLSFAVFKQAPWHHYGLLALEQSQITLRSPFLDNDFVRTVFRAPRSTCENNDISLRLIREGSQKLYDLPTDRGLVGGKTDMWTNLSHQLLEFTFKAEYGYDYGMPQWVAGVDHRIRSLGPERVWLGRHKFKHFRVWYRDHLSDYVREILLDSRTLSRPFFDRKGIETIVEGHLGGGKNYTTEIHKALALELLSRVLIDGR